MSITKKEEIINVDKDVEKWELFYTVDGNVNWYSYYGKQYGGSLKKTKNRVTK